MKRCTPGLQSISDKQLDQAGFNGGREISKSGTRDLHGTWNPLPAYNIIEAESLDAAENLRKAIHSLQAFGSTNLRSM